MMKRSLMALALVAAYASMPVEVNARQLSGDQKLISFTVTNNSNTPVSALGIYSGHSIEKSVAAHSTGYLEFVSPIFFKMDSGSSRQEHLARIVIRIDQKEFKTFNPGPGNIFRVPTIKIDQKDVDALE